jgi:hypothetical protein
VEEIKKENKGTGKGKREKKEGGTKGGRGRRGTDAAGEGGE